MPDLTDEEYDALDEYYAKNPPKIDTIKNGTGFFSRRTAAARTITIDSLSADYLTAKAMATHRTPSEIIRELVYKEINATLAAT